MRRGLKILGFALLTVQIWCAPVWSASPNAIETMQAFLKNTQTLKADFSQLLVTSRGRKPQASSGTLVMAKPGKLRWEVLKPYPQTVVSDGQQVWIYDPDLQQLTVRAAATATAGSPVAFLLGEEALEKRFVLQDQGLTEGVLWLEAYPRQSDAGFEKLRFGFVQGQLTALALHDSFGQVTHIHLTHLERNLKLAPDVFKFKPPPGVELLRQ